MSDTNVAKETTLKAVKAAVEASQTATAALAALISDGKLPVVEAALEALIEAGRLKVVLAAPIQADIIDADMQPVEDLLQLLKAEPVDDTGQLMTCAVNKTDYNKTVVAGATYQVTAIDGNVHLGVDAVASGGAIVDADVLCTVPAGQTRLITMPTGETALHYATDSGAGVTARLSRIVNAAP